MKTRIDTDPGPYVNACVDVKHVGPDGPGPDRVHLLEASILISSFWGIYGACVWTTDLTTAQQIIHFLERDPAVVQDLCRVCRHLSNGPHRPRWNIHHNGLPSILTPCLIQPWHQGPW